jgi:hypothetical protein
MKKYLIAVLFLVFAVGMPVHAATNTKPTPQPSQNEIPTDSAELLKIQKIKDIVASQVAKLNLVEKSGILGKIKETSDTQITITDAKGNIRFIDIDELTKFGSNSNGQSSDVSELKKGVLYSFVGLYNKDTQRLLARDVNVADTIPIYFQGAIVSIDKENFQLTVVNSKGEKRAIDVSGSTKTSLFDKDGELTKSGFSKLVENQMVIVSGFQDKKDENLIDASRIIHFDNIPPSKEIQQFLKTDENNISTGSGKTLETKTLK